MNTESLIENLIQFVNANYHSYSVDWSYERSEGNYTDCFDDGFESGYSNAALEIYHILKKSGLKSQLHI